MKNGKTAVLSGLPRLHFILISTDEWARQALFFFFFFLVVTETLVGLLTLSLMLEPAYDLNYRIIFKQGLIQLFVFQSLQNCRLRNRHPFNRVFKQINQFFLSWLSLNMPLELSVVYSVLNFRLLAAYVFKPSTDTNGKSFFLNR